MIENEMTVSVPLEVVKATLCGLGTTSYRKYGSSLPNLQNSSRAGRFGMS